MFSWIGTIQFLTPEAISSTLDTIAECPTGTRIVISYNQPRDVVQGVAAQVSATFLGIAAEMGEPFRSRFLPDEIEQLLRRHGFNPTIDFGPEEARAIYFHGRTDIDIGGSERLITAALGGSP